MRDLVLVSCGALKRSEPSPAARLYTGPLFRLQLELARQWAKDRDIRILSAKHGVLELDEVVRPYDETLTGARAHKRREWEAKVGPQLRQFMPDRKYERIVGLLPAAYTHFHSITPRLLPLRGLAIGQRKQLLRRAIDGRWSPDQLEKERTGMLVKQRWRKARKG